MRSKHRGKGDTFGFGSEVLGNRARTIEFDAAWQVMDLTTYTYFLFFVFLA